MVFLKLNKYTLPSSSFNVDPRTSIEFVGFGTKNWRLNTKVSHFDCEKYFHTNSRYDGTKSLMDLSGLNDSSGYKNYWLYKSILITKNTFVPLRCMTTSRGCCACVLWITDRTIKNFELGRKVFWLQKIISYHNEVWHHQKSLGHKHWGRRHGL